MAMMKAAVLTAFRDPEGFEIQKVSKPTRKANQILVRVCAFNPINAAKLDSLRQLVEREQLKPIIDAVMPWQQMSQAHQQLEQGGTAGKIVLNFADNG